MMKIGDYVRTINGKIWVIKSQQAISGHKKDIIKYSPNIIDLIEVGDYVNGKRVEWIGYDLYRENEDKTLTGIGEKRILFNEFTKDSVRKKGIMTIVTHEQFEAMEYKVGE